MLNGSTRLDYTNYYEVLPSNALERALFLEADRMRSPAVTEENLANQIAVVKEEIRVNVLNQPYGGFPWLTLPPVLFETFPNAHDGYGAFADLESATVDDARDFFDALLRPGQRGARTSSATSRSRGLALVSATSTTSRDARCRRGPTSTSRRPPPSDAASSIDPHAPAPAVALGWRVPDPADLDGLPAVRRAALGCSATGDASRLRRRLVQDDRLATDVGCHLGLMEDAFDVRDPTALVLEAHHPGDVPTDAVVAAVDEELDRVATDGVPADELSRVTARLLARAAAGRRLPDGADAGAWRRTSSSAGEPSWCTRCRTWWVG